MRNKWWKRCKLVGRSLMGNPEIRISGAHSLGFILGWWKKQQWSTCVVYERWNFWWQLWQGRVKLKSLHRDRLDRLTWRDEIDKISDSIAIAYLFNTPSSVNTLQLQQRKNENEVSYRRCCGWLRWQTPLNASYVRNRQDIRHVNPHHYIYLWSWW